MNTTIWLVIAVVVLLLFGRQLLRLWPLALLLALGWLVMSGHAQQFVDQLG